MNRGEIAYRTPEVVVVWRGLTRRLTVLPATSTVNGSRLMATAGNGTPGWEFEGDEAEDALAVLGVAWMRDGVSGLRAALRELFEPRSTFAAGMFAAEVGAWQRNGGRAGGAFVRQMES